MLTLYTPQNQRPWSGKFAVACSGGFDSMAIADFFVRGGYKPWLVHINHGTGNDAAEAIVKNYAVKHNLNYIVNHVNSNTKDKSQSWEEFWRIFRMETFSSMHMPVITGHNLDDAMETWMFSAMHGQPKLIPYNTNNVYRPFILNRKSDLLNHVIKNNVEWSEDQSNTDVKYVRNRIRHNIMPEIMEINKGFDKVIKKKYLALK